MTTTTQGLSLRESLSIATSSTAPLYSLAVTVILMVPLVGTLGVPIVYLLTAIPSLLICWSMTVNNTAVTSKGSVYAWSGTGKISWLSGFSLMCSGIICTSGLGVYAAQTLIGEDKKILSLIIATIIIAFGVGINVISVRATTIIQNIGMLIQVIALGSVVIEVISQGGLSLTIGGGVIDWVHAVILAVFAFWGFDAVFALSEESEEGVPNRSSVSSIGIILSFFLIGSLFLPATDGGVTESPLFAIALAVSAITAIGSTLIPTVRGIEAMADNGELPSGLSSRITTSMVVAVITSAWMILSVFIDGFFWDSIEAISIFVGFYFAVSAFSAWKRSGNIVHAFSTVLMSVLTLIVLVAMFTPDYGETVIFGVGGVGVIVIVLAVIGVIASLFFVNREREDDRNPSNDPENVNLVTTK